MQTRERVGIDPHTEESGMIDSSEPVAKPGNCHRIALAVEDLQGATQWFQDVLGATLMPVEEQVGGAVDMQADGALLTILWLKNVPIVLLTATDPGGNIGRFLAGNGPSVHSLAWEIPDMWRTENLLRADGVAIVGTDIPGRHFFLHPRHTQGMLLEYTDDTLAGDPRRGAPNPTGEGVVPVSSVVWVTAVVDDLDAAVECLRYTFSAEVAQQPPLGRSAREEVVDVRIGDMTVRLAVPLSDNSLFVRSATAGTGRYHSMTLAVDDFAHLELHLAEAKIGIVDRAAGTVWTDPADTVGLRLQFVDAAALAALD
jgi:catechol 2,3-dioxygenase-like lactoylglutathione lyase family enzyme